MTGASALLSHVARGAWLAVGLSLAACGGTDPVPFAPSHASSPEVPGVPGVIVPPLPTPRPTLESLTLRGRVTEAAPTSNTQVYPAAVTIVDGEHAGLSADVDAMGFYEIPDLRPGAITIAARAEGFVGASRRVDLGVVRTVDFALLPVPGTLHYELAGTINPTDGTCYDGEADRPCRIVMFPVHNDGTIEARLDWTPSRTSDLDLALFRTGSREPIARSAIRGRDNDIVRAEVTGGVTYELRITYGTGTTPAAYTLTFDCPN